MVKGLTMEPSSLRTSVFFCELCNYVSSIFCLCVVVAYKCPSCDKVTETYSGMTKHAGLYHHLDRDRGNWKQLHGEAAKALVRRLRESQTGHRHEPSASTMAGEPEPSRRSSPSPSWAPEFSAETMVAAALNEERDDVVIQAIGPSEGLSLCWLNINGRLLSLHKPRHKPDMLKMHQHSSHSQCPRLHGKSD